MVNWYSVNWRKYFDAYTMTLVVYYKLNDLHKWSSIIEDSEVFKAKIGWAARIYTEFWWGSHSRGGGGLILGFREVGCDHRYVFSEHDFNVCLQHLSSL